MEIVHVVYKNGYQLEDTQPIAINPYKIVWIKAYGGSNLAHILYCRNFDRREQCDDLYLTESYAAILAMCQALDATLFNEYSVYINFVPGHGVGTWTALDTQAYNDLYIEDINNVNDDHEDPIVIRYNNVPTEVSCLRYCEGAFKREKIYIEPVYSTTTTGIPVTTTTEEPFTTTTTEEIITTTTTSNLLNFPCGGYRVENNTEREDLYFCYQCCPPQQGCDQVICYNLLPGFSYETPENEPCMGDILTNVDPLLTVTFLWSCETTTTTTEEVVTTTSTEEVVTTTSTEAATTTTTTEQGV